MFIFRCLSYGTTHHQEQKNKRTMKQVNKQFITPLTYPLKYKENVLHKGKTKRAKYEAWNYY